MTGTGSRFVAAGYKELKPFIKVNGRTIVEHVVRLFPGEDNILFICREDLGEDERAELNRIAPKSKIIFIKAHKLGPVYAVAQALDELNDDEPVICNYCDFYMNWDYQHFLKTVTETGCDGAIPCYTGFHPHLLHPHNVYASCKTDSENYLLEIKEKYSFADDKTQAKHSAGTYYFKKGSYIKKYFREIMQRPEYSINGEYYISLVYNLLCQDQLRTLVYTDIKQFCQWGTPEDFQEYLYWAGIFKGVALK